MALLQIKWKRFLFLIVIGMLVGSLLTISTFAQDKSIERSAKKEKVIMSKPVPAAPVVPITLPEPPLPVQQIQQIGLTQCAAMVDRISRGSLNNQYDVQSGWNRTAPTQHLFQSVAITRRPDVIPANGLTAIVASPTPDGACDGLTVQIFPLASDCATAQAYMQSTGATAIPILDTQIMVDHTGKRIFLLPGINKTCIAVSVDTTFGLAINSLGTAAPAAQIQPHG
ncbi:hypothetical protein [Phyllobacterium sp. P30BS-XVII]|uniref:hypothetical protein n=1 Tax=Phyllobacterium sp. P30BS-XVII TaxID=2587046 RepID=UPI000DD92D3F|nr:hypothetical protein [Phyllobacterium sp. P30BS-XVII]MBA8903047.1 hypothetical protein [Phyllobacterium sp. P30BS-XVII]